MSDYIPPETASHIRGLFRPVTPLNVGDFVVDVHGNYGQIKNRRNEPITDRPGADPVEQFEVEWTERGMYTSRRTVGTRSWEQRPDIFFVKDQFVGEDRTP